MGLKQIIGGCAVAATVLGFQATPQQALAQSLEEAMIEAYLYNPTLQAQRAALRVTDEGVPQASAGWRPNVELVVDVTGGAIHSGNCQCIAIIIAVRAITVICEHITAVQGVAEICIPAPNGKDALCSDINNAINGLGMCTANISGGEHSIRTPKLI